MIDTHCHIDLYSDPTKIALQIEKNRITTILVTNLPSSFYKISPYVQNLHFIKLGLGLHPLLTKHHVTERKLFEKYVDKTFYIGEVGLDFSSKGISSKTLQIESLKFVLKCIRNQPKFVSLHSRKAESVVLELLESENRSGGIFHWYSGPLDVLERAISNGHYFSVNPAMIKSHSGRKIIERIPQDKILTETDGPFIKVDNQIIVPEDIKLVEYYLANLWNIDQEQLSKIIRDNFNRILGV